MSIMHALAIVRGGLLSALDIFVAILYKAAAVVVNMDSPKVLECLEDIKGIGNMLFSRGSLPADTHWIILLCYTIAVWYLFWFHLKLIGTAVVKVSEAGVKLITTPLDLLFDLLYDLLALFGLYR
ncbi:MAG: hypothetical protein LQ352_007874, partial [Teloschistes flavicans]